MIYYPLKRDKRVWVEQPVSNIAAVTGLQDHLGEILPGFVPLDPDDLHVTIVHLGKPQSLYDELIAAGARLDYPSFTRMVQPLISTAAAAVSGPIEVTVQDLAIFGPEKDNMLVARLVPDPRWLLLREPLIGELYKLIVDVGIQSPLQFIHASPSLRFAARDSYQPHVTLGQVPPETIITGLNIPPVELILGPTRLRGVD